jgi:hypothetical protein
VLAHRLLWHRTSRAIVLKLAHSHSQARPLTCSRYLKGTLVRSCGREHWGITMSATTNSGKQPTAAKLVFEFALRPSCSDGKLWPEEQYKTAERLNPDESEADKRKYQEILLKLGGLLRDQFMTHDPKARGMLRTQRQTSKSKALS